MAADLPGGSDDHSEHFSKEGGEHVMSSQPLFPPVREYNPPSPRRVGITERRLVRLYEPKTITGRFKRYQCARCDQSFTLFGDLSSHICKQHARIECPQCKEMFAGLPYLRNHLYVRRDCRDGKDGTKWDAEGNIVGIDTKAGEDEHHDEPHDISPEPPAGNDSDHNSDQESRIQDVHSKVQESLSPRLPDGSNPTISGSRSPVASEGDLECSNSISISPMAIHFPILGRARGRERLRSPCPDATDSSRQSKLPLQSEDPISASPSPGQTPKSALAETSSSDWVEDNQDQNIPLLTPVSCYVLLWTFAKLVTAPSEPEQQPMNKPQQAKNASGRKPSSRRRLEGGKRDRNSSEDELDDEDDPRNHKRRHVDATTADEPDMRPLACPFNKYDNTLFGPESADSAYHSCASRALVTVARLKQHLQRNHYAPRYYCFRCCRRDFSSQAMVAAHVRENPMCQILEPPLYGERIGSDLIAELGLDRKNSPYTDRVAFWHKIYDTFFPGAADVRPVSPYYDGPAAEYIRQFLRFSDRVSEQLMPAVEERLGLVEPLTFEARRRVCQETQQEASQIYLQHIASRRMPRLGRPNPALEVSPSTSVVQNLVSRMNPPVVGEAPSALASVAPETIERNIRLASESGIAASIAAALDSLPPGLGGSHVEGASIPPERQLQENPLGQDEDSTIFDPFFGDEWLAAAFGSPQHNGHGLPAFHFADFGQLGDVADLLEQQFADSLGDSGEGARASENRPVATS